MALVLLTSVVSLGAAAEKNTEKESVSLNRTAFEHIKVLIQQGHVVSDPNKPWSASQPTLAQANQFIGKFGWSEYAKWHLGVAESLRETTKHRYKYPVGDFTNVYRSALMAAKSRAAQYHHNDIRQAATELLDLMDAQKDAPPKSEPSPKKEASPKKGSKK
jgi:hypothetical protein